MNEDKKYNVIKAVTEKRKDKKRACVELDLSIRQVNRLTQKYQEGGKAVFSHGNRGKKQIHAVPENVKKQIIGLYQQFNIKPNVKHFTEYIKGGLCDLLHRYNDSKYFIPSEYYLT